MVAVKQAGLVREMGRRGDGLRLVLVHGSDVERVGLVAAQAVETVCGSRDDPFLVEKLSWTGIGGDAVRVHEEVLSLSMTGGRRAIWLTDGRESLLTAVKPLLLGEVTGNIVIVECESLARTSALRTLGESDSTALCIAVYEADRGELAAIVESVAVETGLSLSAGARQSLIELAGGNSSLLRQEIEKLGLYCGAPSVVTAEDVEKVCGDGAQFSIDHVVDAVFAGRLADGDRGMVQLAEGGISAGRLLSAALEHVFRLQALNLEVMRGSPVETVLRAPRQQIFFKRRTEIKAQLQIWDLGRLQSAGRILGAAIAQSRRNSRVEPTIAARAIMSIAFMARPAPR